MASGYVEPASSQRSARLSRRRPSCAHPPISSVKSPITDSNAACETCGQASRSPIATSIQRCLTYRRAILSRQLAYQHQPNRSQRIQLGFLPVGRKRISRAYQYPSALWSRRSHILRTLLGTDEPLQERPPSPANRSRNPALRVRRVQSTVRAHDRHRRQRFQRLTRFKRISNLARCHRFVRVRCAAKARPLLVPCLKPNRK